MLTSTRLFTKGLKPACGPALQKFRLFSSTPEGEDDYLLFHPVYDEAGLDVKVTHRKPKKPTDYIALGILRAVRITFDKLTGYGPNMTEDKFINRCIFLETVAGVPGISGALIRHLRSLRSCTRDNGRIHTLLEEAENERMHLLTMLELKQPSKMFKAATYFSQIGFFAGYTTAFAFFPKTCHRFIGYLEEEAVLTYGRMIDDLESGKLPAWEGMDAPAIAKDYWKLPEDATFLDTLKAIRADEAVHRHVNHTLGDMSNDDVNPFKKGSVIHD